MSDILVIVMIVIIDIKILVPENETIVATKLDYVVAKTLELVCRKKRLRKEGARESLGFVGFQWTVQMGIQKTRILIGI